MGKAIQMPMAFIIFLIILVIVFALFLIWNLGGIERFEGIVDVAAKNVTENASRGEITI